MDALDISQSLKLLIGLISIVNPIGAIPMFLSLTDDQSPPERQRTGAQAAFAVTIILSTSLFLGEPLLKGLGISLSSFRVAGGILILLMALNMLKDGRSAHKQNPEDERDAQQRESITIVPLSMPLLAGPGAISTAIVFSQQSSSWLQQLLHLGAIAGVGLVVGLCLRTAPWISKVMGPPGMRVMTRIMGLLLAAIGIEFMTQGLLGSFPILGQPLR